MKISQRLNQIDRLIVKRYDHIWDCCCDHGFLGAQLLKREAAQTIHFVDVVNELMLALEAKLQHFSPVIPGSAKWQVHCSDVAKLPLDQYPSDDTHLIIIAGVGGDLLIQLVSQILQNNPDKSLEFIICPVHHNFRVREQMTQYKLRLIQECLVKDNKRFYEIMHLSSPSTAPVCSEPLSNVGSSMWDLSNCDHQEYLASTIAHYQRIQKNKQTDPVEIERIIASYQDLAAGFKKSKMKLTILTRC